MQKKKLTFLGAFASILMFSGAAMAVDDSSAVTSTNQLTTKNYVDSMGRYLNAKDGELTNLTTTNKTNLVSAINEVKGATTTNATNISAVTELANQNAADIGDVADLDGLRTASEVANDVTLDLSTAISRVDAKANQNANDINMTDVAALFPEQSINSVADAISAVKTMAANAQSAADAYTADDGVVIDDDNVIKLNGVADNGKMYVYKNGQFVDVPVVDTWAASALNPVVIPDVPNTNLVEPVEPTSEP